MDRKLNFLIVGAQKAGTTSLHRYLAAHPAVFLPEEKEIDLFGTPERYGRAAQILDLHYGDLRDEPAVGLTYVGMMFLDGVVERVREYAPGMRIVAALRNPVERAYSAYWQHRRTGWDEAPTFEEALAREAEGRLPAGPLGAALSYRRNGCYAEQLQPFVEAFGRDRVSLILTEDLRERTRETVDRLSRWLGAGPLPDGVSLDAQHNAAAMPRHPALQKTLLARDSGLKRIYHALLPERIREPIRRRVTKPLVRRNEQPFDYPEMSASTRSALEHFYAPHNTTLKNLINREVW